jgi:uncharacterized protein YcbX
MTITVATIQRYPVKGLSAEVLPEVALEPGQGLPHDRRFALAHGSTSFDAEAPAWLPKTNFLMLMRDEKLAQLRVTFEPDQGRLTILRGDRQVVRADVTTTIGKTLVSQFFAQFMAGASRGVPKLVEAPGHMFTDTQEKLVSLLNLQSVHDLERVVRRPVDPRRFRANLHLSGAPAWCEAGWIGRQIGIGAAKLTVVDTIERCAATNVNPDTAERDLNIPLQLQQGFGHVTMGVYARVEVGGTIREGDLAIPPEV